MAYKKIPVASGGGGGGAVDSVNGQTGTVVLTTSHITEGSRQYFTTLRGQLASGYVMRGTPGSPIVITNGAILSLATPHQRELIFIAGDSPDDLGGIDAGTLTSQEIVLFGTDDTKPVTVYNSATIKLNGSCKLGAGASLSLVWDGSKWLEVARNGTL